MFSEICHLRRLPKLRVLWLADNPCAVGDRYRMTVLKTLPNLQKLDNKTVSEEEVNEAIEQGLELSFNAGNTQTLFIILLVKKAEVWEAGSKGVHDPPIFLVGAEHLIVRPISYQETLLLQNF